LQVPVGLRTCLGVPILRKIWEFNFDKTHFIGFSAVSQTGLMRTAGQIERQVLIIGCFDTAYLPENGNQNGAGVADAGDVPAALIGS
jgi:hypothetical protein